MRAASFLADVLLILMSFFFVVVKYKGTWNYCYLFWGFGELLTRIATVDCFFSFLGDINGIFEVLQNSDPKHRTDLYFTSNKRYNGKMTEEE